MSAEETEQILLQRLVDQKDGPPQAMWELAQFYKLSGRHDEALAYLRDLIQRLPEVEQKAQCVFTMGQSAEKVGDFAAAVRYYKEAMAMGPTQLKLTEPHLHSIIGCVLRYRPIGRI